MLLHDLIYNSALCQETNTAVTYEKSSLDYATLWDQVARMGTSLGNLGIRPGDRVGIYLSKRVEAVVAYFATSHVGAVFVPINPNLKAPQVQHILMDCNVAALVTTSGQAKGLESELGACRDLRYLIEIDRKKTDPIIPEHVRRIAWHDLADSSAAVATPAKRIDTDIAAILYTSGSTGKPKGVVLSHRNMVAGAISVAGYLENSSEDRILAVLPFSFDAGFSQMTTAFSVGASVVLMDYLLPRDVIRTAAREQITGITGVPPLWNQLSRLEWPEEIVSSLRYIANTGGAMPASTLQTLRSKLPGTKPYLMYGLTESFRSTYLPPDEVDKRPSSIGKAIPNAEVLVVREDGSRCDPGEPGELVHRGALVSLGYWNDPEKTAERYRPVPGHPTELPIKEIAVWSGDTVVMDDEGFLFFVGRKDDMIKSSGYRISPTEVEEVFYGTGLVVECAALGIPHQDLGQAVVVVAHAHAPDDNTKEALLAACRSELPNYMLPSAIIWQESIPRNPNGKIDRKQLAAELKDLFANNED